MPNKADKNDFFANIAAQRIQYRDKALVEPDPPLLPEKVLPAENNRNAVFSPTTKIDSAGQLDVELKNFRETFVPFTRELSKVKILNNISHKSIVHRLLRLLVFFAIARKEL